MILPKYIKLIFSFLLIFVISKTNGQSNIQKLLSEFKYSEDWVVEFIPDTSYFPIFNKKQVGFWNFSYLKDKSQTVKFRIFNYSINEIDSLSVNSNKYILLSSCIYWRSENPYMDFSSFTKGGFYFLLNMCPCRTKGNRQCSALAYAINKWARN